LSVLPSNYFSKLFTNTGAWPKIAAAVLEVGRLAQSPREKTLGYLRCYKVSAWTSTYPLAAARGLFAMTSCGVWGGTRCKKSKSTSSVSPVTKFLKVALWFFESTLVRFV
jgi:hypothetical protein